MKSIDFFFKLIITNKWIIFIFIGYIFKIFVKFSIIFISILLEDKLNQILINNWWV